MNSKLFPIGVMLACASGILHAQTESVMKGRDVTESALIQALTPVAEPSLENEPSRTRSIRVIRDNDSRSAPSKPAKTARASLLITFEPSSAELTSKAKESLDVVGQALSSSKLADFRFAIQGHADPTGQSDANLRLSQLRAESVRQYLVKSRNITNSRLEAIGMGDKDPINTVDLTSPENRRVTIVTLAQ